MKKDGLVECIDGQPRHNWLPLGLAYPGADAPHRYSVAAFVCAYCYVLGIGEVQQSKSGDRFEIIPLAEGRLAKPRPSLVRKRRVA